MDESQLNLLSYAHNQLENGFRWSNLPYGGYAKNVALIASSDWWYADRYTFCGMPGKYGRAKCNQREYCEVCAWLKAKDVLNKLDCAYFKATHWYSLTFTHSTDIDLHTTDREEHLARYTAGFNFIDKAVKSNIISGSFSVAEFSIKSITKLLIYPHVHSIVCSDYPLIDEDNHYSEELVALLPEGCSIHIRPIESREDYERTFKYICKAVDLKKKYDEEALIYPYKEINASLNLMLQAISAQERKYHKCRYYGVLRNTGRNKNYIGYRIKRKKKKSTKQQTDSYPEEKETLNIDLPHSTIVSMGTSPYTLTLHIAKQAAAPVVATPAPGLPTTQPAPQKPSLFRRALPYVLGTGALATGAYLGDKYFNDGRYLNKGVNWLADKLTPDKVKATQEAQILRGEMNAGYRAGGQLYEMDKPRIESYSELIGAPAVATAGALGGAGVAADVGSQLADAGVKRFPTALKSFSGVAKYAPALAKVSPYANGALDAAIGYDIAQNPLVNEGWVEPTNDWWNPANWFYDSAHPRDPEAVRKALSVAGLATGANGVVKGLPGMIGTVAGSATNYLTNQQENATRVLAEQEATKNTAKEYLFNLYRGAKAGNVGSTQYLKRWLSLHNDMAKDQPTIKSLMDDPITKALMSRINNL